MTLIWRPSLKQEMFDPRTTVRLLLLGVLLVARFLTQIPLLTYFGTAEQLLPWNFVTDFAEQSSHAA